MGLGQSAVFCCLRVCRPLPRGRNPSVHTPREGAQNMMDRGRARDVNEAAARFAEILADSYKVVYGQAAESAERQQQRAREFSDLVSSNLREQTEAGRSDRK